MSHIFEISTILIIINENKEKLFENSVSLKHQFIKH